MPSGVIIAALLYLAISLFLIVALAKAAGQETPRPPMRDEEGEQAV